MFKRVEKRQRKKAEEEELGLNEEMKEVLGMHDTDSDESDSDSESESSPTIASEQDVDESKTGSKRKRGDEGDHSEEEEDEGEHTDDEDESEAADEQGLEEAPMSVQEALNEPIFIKSMQPDVKACVVCPGRLLKNARMVDIHRASGGHQRRFKRFLRLAQSANPEDDPRKLLEEKTTLLTKEQAESKRSEKRKAKIDAIKLKREARKAMKMKAKEKAKEKAANAASATDSAQPPSKVRVKSKERKLKKRKLNGEADGLGDAASEEPSRSSKKSSKAKPVRYFNGDDAQKPEKGSQRGAGKAGLGQRGKTGKYGKANGEKKSKKTRDSGHVDRNKRGGDDGLKIFD